jgi:hypothetical protein
MAKFRVWLRPSGTDCKVRVEGVENAPLLRERLKAKGISSSEPIQLGASKQCIFHATCPRQITEEGLVQYVSQMPEVELMLDPA